MDINYFDIEFDHSVAFERDNTIFAVGRETSRNRIRVFRIHDKSGSVYALNAARNSWTELGECESIEILNRLTQAWSRRIPTYTVNAAGC
jgi:hypothetical protein